MTETGTQPDKTEIEPESESETIPELETGPENIYAGIQSGAVRITGVKIDYYHICHTKLWLFSHNITLEAGHENVEIGKQLHEDRYKRDGKDVTIDNTISIDFVRRGSSIELHEGSNQTVAGLKCSLLEQHHDEGIADPRAHFTTSLAFVITGSAPSTESLVAISFAP